MIVVYLNPSVRLCFDNKCSLSLVFNITFHHLPNGLGEEVSHLSIHSFRGQESVRKPSPPNPELILYDSLTLFTTVNVGAESIIGLSHRLTELSRAAHNIKKTPWYKHFPCLQIVCQRVQNLNNIIIKSRIYIKWPVKFSGFHKLLS